MVVTPLVQALTSTLDTVEGALVSFLVIFMVILLPVSPLKLTSTVPSGDKTGVFVIFSPLGCSNVTSTVSAFLTMAFTAVTCGG